MAKPQFKIIKKTPFSNDKAKDVHYICSHNGRILTINTLSFADADGSSVAETEDGQFVELTGKAISEEEVYVDTNPITGESTTKMGRRLMPPMVLSFG